MKIIITESKLNSAIMQYFDELYDISDIHSTNPYMYDDDTGEEFEEDSIVDFYKGDYDGPWDSDFKFRWIDVDYYDESEKKLRDFAPILEIHDEQGEILNAYFGDRWKEPLKIWFEKNFELPIKTVKVGLSG